MSSIDWVLVAFAITAAVYTGCVLALIVVGRRGDARALARFIPDCVRLMRALLRDERVPKRRKALIGLLVVYLASPIDLIPDFIPVAGQLDDAILVALVLRTLLRSGGPALLDEHWPGPQESLGIVRRIAFGNRVEMDPSLGSISDAGSECLGERDL